MQNAILSILFGYAFLIGAFSSLFYATYNKEEYENAGCYFDRPPVAIDLCKAHKRIYSSQESAGVSLEMDYVR